MPLEAYSTSAKIIDMKDLFWDDKAHTVGIFLCAKIFLISQRNVEHSFALKTYSLDRNRNSRMAGHLTKRSKGEANE